MAPNPADRPSARAVLRSQLLPVTVADEALSDLLRSLPEAPETLDRVVDAIFLLPDLGSPPSPGEGPGAPANVQVQVMHTVALLDRFVRLLSGEGIK